MRDARSQCGSAGPLLDAAEACEAEPVNDFETVTIAIY